LHPLTVDLPAANSTQPHSHLPELGEALGVSAGGRAATAPAARPRARAPPGRAPRPAEIPLRYYPRDQRGRGRGVGGRSSTVVAMRFRRGILGMLALAALLVPPAQSSGRLVRVYGDVAAADRVAVIVPGADITLDTFDTGSHRPGGAARALLAEASRQSPGTRLADVACLGYESPPTWSLDVLTDSAAREGARALRRTVTGLRRETRAPIALLCHSYGSVVCAKAAATGLPVADLVLTASPGSEFPT